MDCKLNRSGISSISVVNPRLSIASPNLLSSNSSATSKNCFFLGEKSVIIASGLDYLPRCFAPMDKR